MVLHAFVTSRIDYCNGLLYGLPDCEIAKLQRVQNAAATILDKNVKKNARCMCNLKILPSKARFTQDTPPSPPKKQCWSVARTFLLPTKQHWPGRGGGRGHHGAKFAG